MDFCSGQGVKRSNSSTIARLYNAALGKKTQFYVPDSVQHHTRQPPVHRRDYWKGLSDLLSSNGKRVGRGYLEMTGYARPIRR